MGVVWGGIIMQLFTEEIVLNLDVTRDNCMLGL